MKPTLVDWLKMVLGNLLLLMQSLHKMVLWRKENLPDMKGKVSGKTHTQQQLNNYANQKNPNNKAYRANNQNKNNQKRSSRNKYDIGILDGESFGWCDD